LKSVPSLADAVILNQRPRDADEAVLIQQSIDAALAGMTEGGTSKAGLTILVQLPDGEVNEREAPGPQLDAVLFIRVTENPLVNEGANGTGLHAEDAAALILSALHHWHRDGRAVYGDKRAIRDGDADENGLIEFDVVVRTELGGDVPARVSPPQIALAPQEAEPAASPPDAVLTLTGMTGTLLVECGAGFGSVTLTLVEEGTIAVEGFGASQTWAVADVEGLAPMLEAFLQSNMVPQLGLGLSRSGLVLTFSESATGSEAFLTVDTTLGVVSGGGSGTDATAAGQLATLATSTSGAAIYYTIDGSAPYPGNAEAQLYAAPFAVASGDIIRAAALKSPLVPSFITRAAVS
jgi:hypothetical protein